MDFFRVALLVMRKDLTVEVRSKEVLYTTLFFAVSCVLVFAFALIWLPIGMVFVILSAGLALIGWISWKYLPKSL